MHWDWKVRQGWNHSYLCLLWRAYNALLYHFSRLPTSACASRHAPCLPFRIAFIIIYPAALCLFIITLLIMEWLQPESMMFLFSPEVTLAYFQNEHFSKMSTMPFLIKSWYFVWHFVDWWFGTFFDLGLFFLYWTCMCAFTASRSEKMKSLSNPGWQVFRVSTSR